MINTKEFTVSEANATFPSLRKIIKDTQDAGLALRAIIVEYNEDYTDIDWFKFRIGELDTFDWTEHDLEEWLKANLKRKKQEYEIPVLRIGYACKKIKVIATSEEEAEEKALEEAGNYEFSEHSSEYQLDY